MSKDIDILQELQISKEIQQEQVAVKCVMFASNPKVNVKVNNLRVFS